MYKQIIFLSILTLISVSRIAEADITVNPLLLFFTGGDNVQDLTINNIGNTVAYVEVTPQAIAHVGTKAEQITQFLPSMDINKFGLIVSPLKLAIPVNSYRKVRVVSLNPMPAQDQLYYVNITSVLPPNRAEVTQSSGGGTNISLSSSISYQVQAFVLPAKPMPNVSIKRQGLNVIASNTGNTYASLRNGRLCNESGGSCKPLPPELTYHLLYAGSTNGNTWSFTLPHPGVVKFNLVYAQTHTLQVSSN